MSRQVHSYNSAGLQVGAACLNGPEDDISDCGWKNVLCLNLNHAWTTRLARREERAKIKVVREYDEFVGCGVTEDPRVGGRCLTDSGLVGGFDSMGDKELDPRWAQVHVNQDFHATGRGNSISSTRQAAYASAWRMSSSSR